MNFTPRTLLLVRSVRKLLPALVSLTLTTSVVHAATNTFQAGTSWNTTADWSLGLIPVAGQALLFSDSTFTPSSTVTLDNNFTADTLSFNTAATLTIDANASGTGSKTLTLNNTSTNANGTSDLISLLGGGTINIGVTPGKGTFNTALVATTNNINVGNGGSLVFGANSVISGTSKALSFTGNTSGMLTLSGANTFTGGLTLTSGTLLATNSTGALGAGSLTLAGGTLQLANGSALNFARATTITGNTQITSDLLTAGNGLTYTLNTLSIGAQTLTIAGGANVTGGTAGVTFNGATTLTGNTTFNVVNPVGGGSTLLTISQAISGGSNTLTKTGNGTLLFSGTTNANTYTGLTTVSAGELDLGKNSGTNAIAGDITVGNGLVKLLAPNQLADTSNITITNGGTFSLNGFGDTFANVSISSNNASAPAIFDLGTQLASNPVKLAGSTVTLTFGANTALTGSGTLTPLTTTAPMVYNFNGGLLTGAISTGNAAAATNTTINVTAGMGSGGSIIAGGSGNSVGTTLTVNLNQTGSINLGATLLAYANSSGGRPTILTVNIANTATGMSGGIIAPTLLANASSPQTSTPTALYNNLQNTLTFASGGSGFNFSGGVLDVRSNVATAGFGAITLNGNALTISGGTLLGNSFTSGTGSVTLSSGYLGLRNTVGNITIAATPANNGGQTIAMANNTTGTLTVASGTASQKIIIGSQSTGGTWNQGTINAGSNYTITADSSGTSPFATTTASYTIADGDGLNGIAMGTSAIPTLLTLGANSSFFVASSTAPARTYNVGVTGGSNDIVVASSGGFAFGINDTTAGNTQIINLNRDKGDDTVSLLSNGASLSSAINITTNQSGAGNLYIDTRNLTLNAGITFSGTGGILTDLIPGDGASEQPLSASGLFAGNISGTSAVPITFTINGTLNGTNTVYLNGGDVSGDSSIVLGSTAVIGGTQTWTTRNTTVNSVAFANAMTTPANWTDGSVSFTINATGGNIEASTSSINPTTASDYRFNSFSIIAGNSQVGSYKLTNTVQNDGGSAKEGLYATNFSFNVGDGSGGRVLFNLNGQDLYTDRFLNVNGNSSSGLILQNDALNSVSDIRALGTSGDTLLLPGFQVLNGATLEIVGGNYNTLVSNRSIGTVAADTAAAPNAPNSGNTSQLTLAFNNATVNVGNTSFLGSGSSKGTGTVITNNNSNGVLRVIGGSYTTSGYVLNPVGTTGLIDTTDGGVSPVADTTLNNVTIRGGTSQTITVDTVNSLINVGSSANEVYANGDPVRFAATTVPGGLAALTTYYVINANPAAGTFQVAATPGGAAITLTTAGSAPTVQDYSGATNNTVFPALVVAGTTTVNGNLVIANAPGATNQATLRVGGVNSVGASMVGQSSYTSIALGVTNKGSGYTNGATVAVAFTRGDGSTGTVNGIITVTNGAIQSIALDLSSATGATMDAATTFGAVTGGGGTGVTVNQLAATPVYVATTTNSTALLNVTGDLTVGATNNLAIQSNGTVKVGGNVSIQGIGTNQAQLVTGTGVGIDPASHFTLNGNKGLLAPQTVSIVPALGNFHVGDGSGGTLTGTAAQARLAANLSVITSADINGAASSLNLGGFRLTAGGSGLTVGGILAGTGAITGNVAFTATGTASFNLNGIATAGTDYDQIAVTGAIVQNGILQLNIGSSLANLLAGAVNQTATLSLLTGATPSGSFTSIALTGTDTNSATGNTLVGNSTGITYTYDNTSGMLTLVGASPIPEPATSAALAAAALLAFAAYRRRKHA